MSVLLVNLSVQHDVTLTRTTNGQVTGQQVVSEPALRAHLILSPDGDPALRVLRAGQHAPAEHMGGKPPARSRAMAVRSGHSSLATFGRQLKSPVSANTPEAAGNEHLAQGLAWLPRPRPSIGPTLGTPTVDRQSRYSVTPMFRQGTVCTNLICEADLRHNPGIQSVATIAARYSSLGGDGRGITQCVSPSRPSNNSTHE